LRNTKIALRFERGAWLGLASRFRKRIGAVTAGTFKEGTDFHRKHFMEDRAFHVARAGQLDLARAHNTLDTSTDYHFFGDDLAFEVGLLADGHRTGTDVSVHASIDLDVTRRRQGSNHHEIIRDDRGS
jgi:hypothetical protein